MSEERMLKGFTFNTDIDGMSDEKVEQWEKEQELENKLKAYRSCGVGKRYINKTLSDFVTDTDEQKKSKEIVCSFIDDVNNNKPRTLWLCGKAGTGKTLLGSLICLETYGHFCKSYEINDDLEVAKSFSAKENKNMVLKRYSDYPVLVIDEIGKFKSNSEIEYLFRILNERYENDYSTVIITNLSKEDLKSYIGEPLYDRFVTNCTSFTFCGESYRLKEREI